MRSPGFVVLLLASGLLVPATKAEAQPLTEELLRQKLVEYLTLPRANVDRIWDQNGGEGVQRVDDPTGENTRVATAIAAKVRYSASPVLLEWSLIGFSQDDADELYNVLVNAVLNDSSYTKPANLKDVFVVKTIGPSAPVAKVAISGNRHVGAELTFDGAGSTSASNSISQYDWTFTLSDGTVLTKTGKVVTQAFDDPGLVEVLLSITTESGAMATQRVRIQIQVDPTTVTQTGAWECVCVCVPRRCLFGIVHYTRRSRWVWVPAQLDGGSSRLDIEEVTGLPVNVNTIAQADRHPGRTHGGPEKSGDQPARVWTNATGDRSATATFLYIDGAVAIFQAEDGRIVESPLENLSMADQVEIQRASKTIPVAREVIPQPNVIATLTLDSRRGELPEDLTVSTRKQPVVEKHAATRARRLVKDELIQSLRSLPGDIRSAAATEFCRQGYHSFWSGRNEDADQYFDAAVSVDDNCLNAWAFKAIIALKNGSSGEAQVAAVQIQRILKSDPSRRSEMYRTLSRVQGAIRLQFEQLIRSRIDNQSLIASGRLREADAGESSGLALAH